MLTPFLCLFTENITVLDNLETQNVESTATTPTQSAAAAPAVNQKVNVFRKGIFPEHLS